MSPAGPAIGLSNSSGGKFYSTAGQTGKETVRGAYSSDGSEVSDQIARGLYR
jgi:hypothetical protein